LRAPIATRERRRAVKKILVVDDESDVVDYLTTLFQDKGYATLKAYDGEQALQLLKVERPDLVTLDITMPNKSGVRFYRDLKESEEFRTIPVIIVTGVTGFGGDPEGFRRFVSSRKQVPPPEGFMSKPIDRTRLLKMVADQIG
jgi:CheY-like chemotaxis protein